MGLFSRFKRTETVVDEKVLSDPLLKAIIGDQEINRESALEIPAVSEAVDLICNTFAMIPFKLYQESVNSKGKRTTKEVDDPRVNIINNDTGDK